ncbi:hypothetical protein PIB30_070271, partial [Stylosanthes scabra]|nr:hypothetical protein [Stylosanthes scabra]
MAAPAREGRCTAAESDRERTRRERERQSDGRTAPEGGGLVAIAATPICNRCRGFSCRRRASLLSHRPSAAVVAEQREKEGERRVEEDEGTVSGAVELSAAVTIELPRRCRLEVAITRHRRSREHRDGLRKKTHDGGWSRGVVTA